MDVCDILFCLLDDGAVEIAELPGDRGHKMGRRGEYSQTVHQEDVREGIDVIRKRVWRIHLTVVTIFRNRKDRLLCFVLLLLSVAGFSDLLLYYIMVASALVLCT